MLKKLFVKMVKYLEYSRMVQVLNSLNDKQLKDIGILRADIPEVAKKATQY